MKTFLQRYLLVVFFTVTCCTAFAQTDMAGSGRAILFDGIDDYIDFGDRYADLEVPFTCSAWAYYDPAAFYGPIFSNRNCFTVYTGFRLIIDDSYISVEYGDGFGGGNPAFRRGKEVNLSFPLTTGWNHITAVVRDVHDMELYVNGVNVGGQSQGDSENRMRSDIPDGLTSSGYFVSNNVTYRYKGLIDDIRLWNRALSEAEIRNTMCVNLSGNEPGLIGYWDFNETSGTTVFDKSPNHFTGNFAGDPVRVFSGAPIGNTSTFLYAESWAGKSISLTDGDGTGLTAKNIAGDVEGVQIYKVEGRPSQDNGLDNSPIDNSYFGVFLISPLQSGVFDVEYTTEGTNDEKCKIYHRNDNSVSSWDPAAGTSAGNNNRREFIAAANTLIDIDVDLGADLTLCDVSSHELSAGLSDPFYTYHWSNGATTPNISVTKSGLYKVTVRNACTIATDSVRIKLNKSPAVISLGDDVETCNLQPIRLTVDAGSNDDIEWQDGSTEEFLDVTDFGKYWVKVTNSCGEASDTLVVSRKKMDFDMIPNVITPNGDQKNDVLRFEPMTDNFSLRVINRWGEEVYQTLKYDNNWSGGDLSAGVYYFVAEGDCGEQIKSPLTIMR